MVKVAYEPISAKDALKQIKDLCSIILDLAFSSVFYEDKRLAEEVGELRDLMVRLSYLLTMSLQVAVRDGKDAQATLPLVVLGEASKNIANSAVDIANVLLKGFNIHKSLKELSQKIARDVMRGEILEESILNGYSLKAVAQKMNYSVIIFALSRDGKWTVAPDQEMELQAGDVILARGSSSAISLIKLLVGESAQEISPPEEEEEEKAKESFEETIVDYLISMKDTSEVMVDLAYGAVLYNNKELAQLVSSMEKRVDTIRNKSELAILRATKAEGEDLSALQGLIRVIEATEFISDFANEIAKVVLAELPAHPIIELVVGESVEGIFQKTVEELSLIVGKTVPAGNYLDEFGIRILAIKRAAGYFFKPRRRIKIRAGDVIIFTGPQEACIAFQREEKEAEEEKAAEMEAKKKAAEEVVEEVVEKVAEEVVSKTAKKAVKKTAKEVAGKAAERATEKVAKKAATEAAEEVAKEVVERLTEEMAEQVAEEVVKETFETVKAEQPTVDNKATEKALKEAAEGAAKKSAKGAGDRVRKAAKEAAEQIVEEKADVVAKKATKAAATKAAKEAEPVVKEAAKTETQKAAMKAATEAIKETVSVEEPEQLVKKAAEEGAKEVAEKATEKAVEKAGKKVAEKTAEEVATEVVEKETKKVAKKAAEEAAKEVAEEVIATEVKEAAQKAAEEVAEKAVEKAAKETEEK